MGVLVSLYCQRGCFKFADGAALYQSVAFFIRLLCFGPFQSWAVRPGASRTICRVPGAARPPARGIG